MYSTISRSVDVTLTGKSQIYVFCLECKNPRWAQLPREFSLWLLEITKACFHVSLFVLLSVPDPIVVVTSTPVSPVRPIGSNITLTCIVDLSPAVDVPVTVTTEGLDQLGL